MNVDASSILVNAFRTLDAGDAVEAANYFLAVGEPDKRW